MIASEGPQEEGNRMTLARHAGANGAASAEMPPGCQPAIDPCTAPL